MEHFNVSRDDGVYSAWPDVVMTKAGKLICVFTECAHHGDRTNSRVMTTESTDRGRTWSERKPFSEMSQGDFFFNNSRISRLPDDSLVILCDRADSSVDGENGPGTVIYMWRGDPEGNTFGEPTILPFCAIVPDKLRVLSTGRWTIAAHNKNLTTGKLEMYLWYSDDEGKTWSDRVTVASDVRYNLCEPSILELKTGELVCFMRENSRDGIDCLKVISHDKGITWSQICRTPIPGCHRPVVGYLQDGSILMTYRFMQGGKGWLGAWTQNFFAAISDEASARAENRREQWSRIFPLAFDRSPVSDLGYSGWVQFDDGEIYAVYYIVDDAPKGQIRGVGFRKEDYLLSEK